MKKQKIWRPFRETSEAEVKKNAAKLGVNDLFAKLLLNRDISSTEQASTFFNPPLDGLHDPMLMPDMDKAVKRLTQAYNKQETVWVYGDYDVDGTTSVALVFSFLREFIVSLDYYAPDREKEGYGISKIAIDAAAKAKVKLIVALDCGIRSVELVAYASSLNIDFIICDHHVPGPEIPNAIAVLDAKRVDSKYPFDELCGCGVGFKLVQALCTAWHIPDEAAFDYLDFVAVSIASDLVPIVGENRILTHYGMKKLNENPSPGLKMVIEKFINKPDLDITNVVFMIGPRINAAGRMADARTAIRLLLAEDEVESDQLAAELNTYNITRKGLDEEITKEALNMIVADLNFESKKTTVVYAPHWHKGVVGIVASRLIEKHFRPTIVLTKSGNDLVGSARSIEGFDVHEALTSCAKHLMQFGGHKYAAGMKLSLTNLEDFKLAFEKSAESLSEQDLTEVLKYEDEIPLSAINNQLVRNLKRFAPHGPGNMKPVFLTRNVWDTGMARTLGKTNDHLKLNVVSADQPQALGAICFGLGNLYEDVRNGKPFDMLYTIEENHFRGEITLQLMVVDIRCSSKSYVSSTQ